ncbi:MAG: anaerobic glycerol-3-phosphate dehydrogenase subunit GlpB [Thermodesulfobacteriota bacterium]
MEFDIIVIGMGLSGLMAAKTALDLGKRVLIIGKGMGGITLFSNSIDILGKIPDTLLLKDGINKWIQENPKHPYTKVGVEGLEEAISFFVSLFAPPYTFQSHNQRNIRIPTAVGTYRLSYLIPSTLCTASSLNEGNSLIIGFKGFKDFYAGYMAREFKCRHLTLSLHEGNSPEVTARYLSRLMEQEEFRERIGIEIKKALKGEKSIVFPAVFGLNDPMKVKEHLETLTGVRVFETPSLPPSILGLRIFNSFKSYLIERGAHFLIGQEISKVQLKGSTCKGIEVFHPPLRNFYSSQNFVLATGRFLSGGLRADQSKIYEPIFNLPVFQPESPERWFEKTFFGIHPIHHSGILTDEAFRPIDHEGKPILDNVRVVGTILSGHHFFNEGSREGIEIVSGYWGVKRIWEDQT